ncbi:MAG: CoA ester lyase [Euryarchaeota archaeon]|nr:CoA ester lyase [Euryarchaeota archaeon]
MTAMKQNGGKSSVWVRRTELTTPAHSMKMMSGAASSKADEVMLDLEDACAMSQKVGARKTLVEAATTLDWSRKILAFRPNNLRTHFFFDDMVDIIGGAGKHIDVLILPKTEYPDEVNYVDRLLSHLELKFGLPVGRIGLEVLIESSVGILRAEEIARSSPRMQALIFGVADYSGDTGALLTTDIFSAYHYAKQKTIAAAKAAGLDAVDCVTLKFKDLALTQKDAEMARAMGFDGKWAIHPGQVDVINKAFTPSPEEIEKAGKIIAAYRQADVEKGLGAIVVGEEMVDRATIRVEERKLAIARKAGLLH